MATVLLSLLLFPLLAAALALGTICKRGPIKGSCGGLGAIDGAACDICAGVPAHCGPPAGDSPAPRREADEHQ